MSSEEKKELALCVDANQVHLPYGEWRTYLMDRDIVDDKTLYDANGDPTTDAAIGRRALQPKIQQILPYVTILRHSSQVLGYGRGKGGGESRLHGNISIGFGGHPSENVALEMINVSSSANDYTPQYIIDSTATAVMVYHLAIETLRELDEELKGFFAINTVKDAPREYETLFEDPENNCPALFYAIIEQIQRRRFIQVQYAPVDRVHLGISIVLDLTDIPLNPDSPLLDEEQQVINKQWLDIDEIEPGKPTYAKLEGWSKHVVRGLLGMEQPGHE